jgi:acetylornithine deacetylase/succinyl-diaminopimelate desuccinylase-like protein
MAEIDVSLGPALSWVCAVEAFQKLGKPLLVNVKIVFEGMEEYGSEGIFDLSPTNPRPHQAPVAGPRGSTGTPFFDNDFFCIRDAVWLGKRKPCLAYGLRGIAYFALSVRKH